MGWSIGAGVGPLRYSKRIGGKGRKGGRGNGEPMKPAHLAIGLVIVAGVFISVLVPFLWIPVGAIAAVVGLGLVQRRIENRRAGRDINRNGRHSR